MSVRSRARESGGVWSVYAGVRPTGVIQGVWSPARRTLVFNPRPELTVAPPGSPGAVTQKVTGFADCGGALYTTINTTLYRRNDGALPPGIPRWVPIYEHHRWVRTTGAAGDYVRLRPRVGVAAHPTEGSGNVYRFDDLARGQLDTKTGPSPGSVSDGLVQTLEFQPGPAIRQMLAAQGAVTPATGRGSIAYVIAAYNNGDFESMKIGGVDQQVFGFEWGYPGVCPTTQKCGPIASGVVRFNASACFAVRSDQGQAPTYTLRCLAGPTVNPSAQVSKPIRSGQAFVSIRSIVPSPFADGRIYTPATTAISIPPTAQRGWQRPRSVLSASPFHRRKFHEAIHEIIATIRSRRCRRCPRRSGAGAHACSNSPDRRRPLPNP